ncbi:hypothetical protein BpHYR1_049580 [Brachionus plicatilis]|uniref:FLYWCH-type domain-containing protein n=1 Tax=Brachionus plicatilis TaxID=10195 RepID=A0A3M7SSI3_BRAPC|nr:hypothetical protein BpHYR1_049580 [Brachionus plicatilis]
MNYNSPFVNKLRSNKNYKPTDPRISKKKVRSEKRDDIDFELLIDKACCSNVNVNIEVQEDENFLSNISFELEEDEVKDVANENLVDNVMDKFNNLALTATTELTWDLQKSQLGGYKLFSLGYGYLVEKPNLDQVDTAEVIYWRCDKWRSMKCTGRAEPSDKKVNAYKNNLKSKASSSYEPPRSLIRDSQKYSDLEFLCRLGKKEAITKMIIRERNKDLQVPTSFQFTTKDKLFYFEDSGLENKDESRVIIFTTESNLKLLNTFNEWYADGTFDISPSFFKQVYTIHVLINGTNLPLVYGILPDKKETIYVKFLRLVKKHLSINPKFVNCDFEKAAINAFQKVFKCEIHGCFFQLITGLV